MRKITLFAIAILAVSLLFAAFAEEARQSDPSQLFYAGNSYYEKRDYAKAIEEYTRIIDMGLESGSLYYNIGNCFLKLGKIGNAVLFYERAKRLMPQDSDLRSNLAYARSLVGDSGQASARNLAARIVWRPFRYFNLNAVAASCVIFYLILILTQIVFLLKPHLKRRFRILIFTVLILFLFNLAAFGLRYYREKILTSGVVVQKEAECKYEPIDKSTTYYNLQEGSDVFILKTRNGWRQIRRPDGKIGWVKKEAVWEV